MTRLFCRFINGRLISRQGITKLRVRGKIYEDPYAQAEIMNKSLQSEFTKEIIFGGTSETFNDAMLKKIRLEIEEVSKILESLDVENSPGADGISNWII